MITENLSTLKIHKLTQAQYDRELANGNIVENAMYLTPDEPCYTKSEVDSKISDINTSISEQITAAVNEIDMSSLSGVEIVDARSSNYDMDALFTQGEHFKIYLTNASTLGTPKADGLVSFAASAIISYANSATYGFQIALINGGANMYQRAMNNGTIGSWSTNLTNVLNNSVYGTSLPSAGTKGRIFFKKVSS